MQPGTRVRLKSNPSRHGITTGSSRPKSDDRIFWQITFPDGSQYIDENQIEIVDSGNEDVFDLFRQGKFGGASDLRGAITHIRLSGRLADLIYSMETTNTDFYPYQFKPVLNFLESPSGGILIADEVGLGKTIEAGLIWTELRSRYDTRRLMVLCPAILREKWKMELQSRFGISATIFNTMEALHAFQEFKAGNLSEFAIIASMQGMRPNRGWEDDDSIANKASVKLAKFLNNNAHDDPLLDLLIIDEAHYLRNPKSMTSRLGRLLREVASHIALLSATPIHLKNEDLYQLLNLVDEDSFNQVHVFDDILQANAPLIRARDMILSDKSNVETFIDQLSEAKGHVLLSDNRQLQAIIDNPPDTNTLQSRAYRSELAHRLESINLLGRAVTRTRKREVTERRVIREATSEVLDMTPVEDKLYTEVTSIVRKYCLKREAHEGFLLVTPQRQIASSMPAALREWQRRKFALDQSYEDLGENSASTKEIGPLVRDILDKAKDLGSLKELWENDSKYKRLSTELKGYLKNHPKEKIVIFAYFRATLQYLHERLASEGFNSLVLVGGGVIDKYEIMEQFQNPEGPNILLASEVASEGVDLQFSRVLVNYDLPWNPMKVEQRIGRIDRIGQTSPKISIWNLFYANTIDARIYERLYMRLGIFKYALGGLDAVLGEEIKKMTIDLMKGTLSQEQEEARITQTQQAISNLRNEEERLEQNANKLIAHGEYILHQVQAARELGRWISGKDIWIYIRDFFNSNYPGCEFRQLESDKLIFEIKLSEDALFDFDRFIQANRITGQTQLTQCAYKPVSCQFKNQVPPFRHTKYEQINQFHPLTRFVSKNIQEKIRLSEIVHFPSVSLRLNKKEVPMLQERDYLFYVERWTVQGMKDIERMVYYARPVTDPSTMLGEEEAEKLVTCAAKTGVDWLSAGNDVDIQGIVPLLEECIDVAERKYSNYITTVENENNDRADLQEKTLNLHRERQREKLQTVLKKHKERGNIKMLAPTQGQIDKMENKVKNNLRLIKERRALKHHRKDVCLGIIRVE